MSSVVVEGTLTPAAGVLGRGERATWAYTSRIQDLANKGRIKIIKYIADDDEAAEPAEPPVPPEDHVPSEKPTAPARNASLTTWQQFFDAHGLTYPQTAGRDDLVAAWVQIEQQQAGGS